MSYEYSKYNQFFPIKNNDNDDEPVFNIPLKVINLPYQTANLSVQKQKLNRMETIKEKETEYNNSEKTNIDISKNKLTHILNNPNNSSQDLSTNIPNTFIPTKKIQSIKPYIEDINNFENDQLNNTSDDDIFGSEEESENFKKMAPYATYNNNFLNKYNLYNLKLSINNKKQFMKTNNDINFKRKKFSNSSKNNNINYLNYQNNLKSKQFTRNSIFSDIHQNRYLDQVNFSSKKRDKNIISPRDKIRGKILARKNTSCLTEKKNQNYLSVDLTKIDNFKSNKKKKLEIKQKIKIRQIKSKQKVQKKKFLKKINKNNLNVKYTDKDYNKNDFKLIIPRNQTDYGVEFPAMKDNYMKTSTFNNNKLNINNNIENIIIDNYHQSPYKSNTINAKSKSKIRKRNDFINCGNNLNCNSYFVKTKTNNNSVKKKKSKKKRAKNIGSVGNRLQKEKSVYHTNPFINDSINRSVDLNENNNNIMTKVISIVEKKLEAIKKNGIVNESKKKKNEI